MRFRNVVILDVDDLVTRGDICKTYINTAERLILAELNYEFKELLNPRNLAAVVIVISTIYDRPASWLDVKILIWKSQARGRVTQLAVSQASRARIETSGQLCLQRLIDRCPIDSNLKLYPIPTM